VSAAAPAAPITVATVPGVDLLFKREQEPNDKTPLTYREYVYRVAVGTEPLVAKALVIAQFDLVKATLVSARPGQLVNLAIFDVAFTGKPPVPPLVTLSWKDWKGDPTIEFPRSKAASKAPPRPAAGTPASAPPPAAAVAPSPHPPPPAPAPTHASPAAPAAATIGEYDTLPSAGVPAAVSQAVAQAVASRTASAAPMAPAVAGPSVVVEPPRPAPPAAPAPQPAPLPPPPPVASVVVAAPQPVAPPVVQPVAQPAAVRPPPSAAFAPPSSGSVPTPFPAGGNRRSRPPGGITRMRGDELIADLFEVMHDLHFLEDAIQGSDFCLTLAMEKMPSRAGLVHLYDIDKREFVITCARGDGSEALLLRRYPENDPLLRAAMRKQRATVIVDARTGDAATADRYRALGGAKSVVVAPVMLQGRFLGAIELLDPTDGAPFTDNEGHALSYIGEQFGEFVASRGVLLDPERIAPKAALKGAR
jgi:hypothetical protein